MDIEHLAKTLKNVKKGLEYATATIIESTLKGTPQKTGAKMIVFSDGTSEGTIGGGRYENAVQKECLEAIKSGECKTSVYQYFGQKGQSICGGEIKVFIEPFLKSKRLVICGGGHIGLALSFLGKLNDFEVIVIDNRRDYSSKKRFSHVDQVLCGAYRKQLEQITWNENDFVMITTQGNEHDFECLEFLVHQKTAYLGVISSKPKRVKFLKRLREQGVSRTQIQHVQIPAGLDIGGTSPGEIATSIIAEIIACKNKNQIGTAKFKDKEKS